jgi:flagellar hook assembly protein FlgD
MLSATVTGEQQYSWDGTGINGTKLPAGIYLLELEQNSLRSHAKLILAK